MNFFFSLGNDYDSFESLESKNGLLIYKSRGSLVGKETTLDQASLTNINRILMSKTWQSFCDPAIGANPTPGEPHYNTRNTFYLKVPSLNFELKVFIDSPHDGPLSELINAFTTAIKKAYL